MYLMDNNLKTKFREELNKLVGNAKTLGDKMDNFMTAMVNDTFDEDFSNDNNTFIEQMVKIYLSELSMRTSKELDVTHFRGILQRIEKNKILIDVGSLTPVEVIMPDGVEEKIKHTLGKQVLVITKVTDPKYHLLQLVGVENTEPKQPGNLVV